MTTRFSACFKLAAAILLAAACSGEVAPPSQVNVRVDPGTLQVDSGASGRLDVWVANARNSTVTWASSDDAVATVQGGVVTGAAPGSAVITAVSNEEPAARDSAVVTVRRPPPSTGCYNTIAIRSITGAGTGEAVQQDNVSGSIVLTVSMLVCRASASRTQIIIGQTPVWSQDLPSTGPEHYERTVTATINTAERDPAGNLRFPNGPYDVSAQVVHPSGAISAANNVALTFKN